MAKNLVSLNVNNETYSLRPYAICSTGAANEIKIVNIEDFSLFTGATICIKFANANSHKAPLLNVNQTGAIAIKCKNYLLNSEEINEFIYDGTNWVLLNEPTSPHTWDINQNVTFPANITSTGNLIVNGNTTLGNATTDTITAKTSILPSGTINLGSTSSKWANVYATIFNGNLTGTASDSNKLGGTDASAYALKTDITDLVDLTNNQTITGLKKFQSTSTSDNLTGVSLILQNNGWVANMSTALDFYNGTMYNVPNSRISTLMDGAGFAGGTMIFSTQTKHESTIPNPNELVERMRINDQGLVKISGDLEVTGNITGTVAKANDSDNLGGIAASAYALKTDIETLEEATTTQIQNIFN